MTETPVPSNHPQSPAQHRWQPVPGSPGVELCELCHTERRFFAPDWLYFYSGAAPHVAAQWEEPSCGVPCPQCFAELRAKGDGCDVCKGAGMVPRGQSEIGAAGGG